jgi:hypothetical protein
MGVRLSCLTSLLLGLSVLPLSAQTPPPAAPQAPAAPQPAPTGAAPAERVRVYLDCFDCFPEYLRDEIDWVDFVREPQEASVHLLSSSRETGGGGREVVLRFVGRDRFEGHDHDLRAITVSGDTENTRRAVILRTAIAGLLDYAAHDGLPPGLDLDVETSDDGPGARAPVDDPWDYWVFEIGGRASLQAEESTRQRQWGIDFTADRVTEQWKIAFGIEAEQEYEQFDLDEDDPFEVDQRERSFDFFVARSLGPHWSVGFDGRAETSTFGNTKVSMQSAPAIEYSFFPYSEYATRQFRVQYEIGVERAEYNEITLFDKLRETVGRHELSATLDQRQPWGSIQLGAEFSQYLHDTAFYRLQVDGEISIRITRGLEVEFEGRASRIRDQISLARRDAMPEEVLLRLRELRSGYEVQFQFGLSYRFGSIFNNIVNPRFGGNGGGGGDDFD